ncbi:MAG: protein-L-isoaspartate O-methyltransferase [Alphaproteobacteria bacterium]|nr:protein-L-isoaspartate O-methyltransferase [Alphaproteobacteria bacterium]
MTDYSTLRTAMVDCQVRPSDVTKFPIIEAMLSVPREVFVPSQSRSVAYAGDHVFLGNNRIVMDARLLAKMLDALDICGKDLVLDIGCGLGYSSAIIAHLAEAVIAVEEDDALALEAEANLTSQSVDNAIVVTGALTDGAAKHGPYDAIFFSGGVAEIPAKLLEQLKEGGRVAALFIENQFGQCKIGVKADGRIAWRTVFDGTAPILPGFEPIEEFAL